METTLSLVKPDGVRKNYVGEVIRRFEREGLKLIGLRMLRLSKGEAEGFYIVHKNRPFYNDLTHFMSSGPIVAMAWVGEDAVKRVRAIMGATDPRVADKGTIRGDLGNGIEENVVHGSDSRESAQFELPYFFSSLELNG